MEKLNKYACLICLDEQITPTGIAANHRKSHLRDKHPEVFAGKSDEELNNLANEQFISCADYKNQLLKEAENARLEEEEKEREAQKMKELEEKKKKALEAAGLLAGQHPQEEISPSTLDLPPGKWFVKFLMDYGSKHGVKLDEDEMIVLESQYREDLPDPNAFSYLLQTTFGVEKPKVPRLAMVYDHFLTQYVKYQQQKDRPLTMPGGTIKVKQQEHVDPYQHYPGEGVRKAAEYQPYHPRFQLWGTPHYPSSGAETQPPDNPPNIVEIIEKSVANAVRPLNDRLAHLEGGGTEEAEYNRPLGVETLFPQRRPISASPSPLSQLESDPTIRSLTLKLDTALTEIQSMKVAQQQEALAKKEQEERQKLINDIIQNVKTLIASEIGPLSEDVKNIRNIVPTSAFANLGLNELLQLKDSITEGSIKTRKMDLAEQKYLDEREGSKEFRKEVVGGIKSIGDTIGTAIAETVQKGIHEKERPAGGGHIRPTQTGNLIQFPCENCGKMITSDVNAPVATCLCGAKYQLLVPGAPQAPVQTPQAPVQPQSPNMEAEAKTKKEGEGTDNIMLVPRGGGPREAHMPDM